MAKVTVILKDSDPGFVKIIKRIQGPGKSAIGYFKDQGNSGKGILLVKQAADNELGTLKIPSRPFLRRPFDQNKKILFNRIKKEAMLVIAGRKTKKQVLEEISKDFIKLAQKGIDVGPWLDNALSTQARKGFNKPLIETGEMASKMTFRLRKK